jgi:hypothetical protein
MEVWVKRRECLLQIQTLYAASLQLYQQQQQQQQQLSKQPEKQLSCMALENRWTAPSPPKIEGRLLLQRATRA